MVVVGEPVADLEILRIKGGDDLLEELIEKVEFNGVRYSFKLL